MTTATVPLRLALVLGSDREGRFVTTVRDWLLDRIELHGGFVVDVIDPVELALPERFPAGPDDAVDELRRRLADADAFLFVTPEYNHSYPAALKRVLDLAKGEWARKSAGIVSYGGISGGLRATEALRVVLGAFDTHAVADTLSIHGAAGAFDGGVPRDPGAAQAADRLLDAVQWWGRVLRRARQPERIPLVA